MAVLVVQNPPANAGDAVSISGLGRTFREGNGNLLQCSCLGNHMDRGVWRAAVNVVSESQTQQGTHMVGIISVYE